MTLTKKPHFRGSDFNNQELKDAKSLQLNQDASLSDEAVRLSQAESISASAVQSKFISLSASASNDTAFTSQSMVGFLSGKQSNMEIDASSSAYLQIIDGYKIKATQLLITDVEVNETCATLQIFIDTYSPTKQQGDVVILTSAADNQERSWIKTGSASQNVDGYTRLQTDYNVTSIRAMLSSGDTYISYDSASGQYSLNLGTSSTQLGAQNIPVDSNEFASIVGDNSLAIMKALETLVLQVEQTGNDGTATVTTRINNLNGVTGNNFGTFTGDTFSDNLNAKQLFQESENAHETAATDRELVRSQFTSGDSALQNNLNAETASRVSGDLTESNARYQADQVLESSINNLSSSLVNESQTRFFADNAIDARLDIIEGSTTTTGSIAKAQVDAQAFASNAVNNEAIARQAADVVLQNQIDAIADAFQYKGNVASDGRIVHIDTTDANHQKLFENASFEAGDMYKMNVSKTITFSDTTTLEVEIGDSLVSLSSCPAGTCGSADFHKWDNTEASDILREGMLDNVTLEKSSGILKVIADSITRTQLSASVETDIDNKVLKSGDTMTGALKIDKVVLSGTGYTGGYDFASYIKQKSVDTASLTDTQRALLVENEIYTDGSGNPLDLDYANATTSASHYKGGSNNMTVAAVGTHSESSVSNSGAAVYATGSYGVATSPQLGVNSGGTFVAQNASTSNLGIFSFSDTAGALNNRAGYFALAPDNLDFDGYRVARVGTPLPVQDAAVVIDDYAGTNHALYVNGKSEFVGKVIVQDPAADNEALNLGFLKSKEHYSTFDVSAQSNTVINHGLGSKKLVISLWLDDEEVTGSFDIEKTSNNSITIYNNTTSVVEGAEICLYKLSV